MDGGAGRVSAAQQQTPLWVLCLFSRLRIQLNYNDTHGLVATLQVSNERLLVIYLTRIFVVFFVNGAE